MLVGTTSWYIKEKWWQKTSVKVYKWILWMALHLTDACYETRNQVKRLMMFTTLCIKRKYHKKQNKELSQNSAVYYKFCRLMLNT